MPKTIFYSFVIVFISGCISNESKEKMNTTAVIDSAHKIIQKDTIKSLKGYDFKSTKEIYRFIKDFSVRDFSESRKQLIADGAEFKYKVSPIKSYGKLLKYHADVPDLGKYDYTCYPAKGEFTMTFIGHKDVALNFFNQNKLGFKNPQCNTTEAGEECKSYEDWKDYPLTNHFTTFIINNAGSEEIATVFLKRQITIK